MSFKDKYPVKALINENEEQVFKAIDNIMAKEKDICTCQDCMLDVAALALNNLMPSYRVFLMRTVHRDSELVNSHLRKVEEAVCQAIAVVRKKPNH